MGNGVIRPNVVFFGEPLPQDVLRQAEMRLRDCSVMLVVGTSGVVQPAASLPLIAREHGSFIVEINPESTPLTPIVTDYFICSGASEALKSKRVRELL